LKNTTLHFKNLVNLRLQATLLVLKFKTSYSLVFLLSTSCTLLVVIRHQHYFPLFQSYLFFLISSPSFAFPQIWFQLPNYVISVPGQENSGW
jgi:hypothetical protein